MSTGRRNGAPRLIDWTGERCVPWAPDAQLVYEHIHRYLWAGEIVRGRRVLDLGSGEGFGASILARTASEVTGVDIDQQTVDHSALNYSSDPISFVRADARDLSAFPDDSFDAVVAFEMIEHVPDQSRVLLEIARLLAPGGVLIMSTPDRRTYTEALADENPFRVRELSFDEFTDLLESHFTHHSVWGQRTITGSTLSFLSGSREHHGVSRTFFVQPDGEHWSVAPGMSPTYLVAVASLDELPDLPAESTLADAELRLVREAEETSVGDIAEEANGRRAAGQPSAGGVARETAMGELQLALGQREAELAFRRRRAVEAEAALEASRKRISELTEERDEAREIAIAMPASVTWQALRGVRRRLVAALGGPGSVRVRFIRGTVRRMAHRALAESSGSDGAVEPLPPIILPQFAHPDVSIVVPLFRRADLTEACLRSIADHTSLTSYEVILVDDGADAETKELLSRVQGATVLVNENNQGYLRSVNRGAAASRGEWIVLCNNDIEMRQGWLQAMLECGKSAGDVGIVAPRYLFPDLTVNEAGGIIWRDATGMNYGRGQPAHLFHYGFRREVDYASAAALMVRASLWDAVGGYDERYLPMYYEDADLCFAARERGFRVLYEPRAEVIHVEGATAGTDLSSGHKSYQEVNRMTFAQKWSRQLATQPRPGTMDLRGAANRARGPRVLIVDYRMPSWDRDAGSLRLWHMIDELVALGCRIILLPDDRKLMAPYGPELERMGVEVWHGDINIHAEMEAVGAELSMVVLCRPHTAARWMDLVREQAPGAKVVYDTIDLHWLREIRRDGGKGVEDVVRGTKAAALRELELAVTRASDAVLAVTEVERGLLIADVPDADVRVVPTVHTINHTAPPFAARDGVLFVGGFDHPPNVDAAVKLVKGVMPLVWRRLGPIPVSIVGGSVPREVARLGSSLVDVTGWLPEIEPALDRARALVVPLTWGAGIKGKVTQALAAGLPVVTTTIGAEGLDATDGKELLIADEDNDLAERVILALTDEVRWGELSRDGLTLAEARFSSAVMARELRTLLSEVGHSVAPSPDATRF